MGKDREALCSDSVGSTGGVGAGGAIPLPIPIPLPVSAPIPASVYIFFRRKGTTSSDTLTESDSQPVNGLVWVNVWVSTVWVNLKEMK